MNVALFIAWYMLEHVKIVTTKMKLYFLEIIMRLVISYSKIYSGNCRVLTLRDYQIKMSSLLSFYILISIVNIFTDTFEIPYEKRLHDERWIYCDFVDVEFYFNQTDIINEHCY